MDKLQNLEQAVRNLYESKNPNRTAWADWLYADHVFVVSDFAESIAKQHVAPIHLCRAAAVLHDIADSVMSRFSPEHEQSSLDIARQLLNETGFSKEDIKVIVDDAIRLHSCRGDLRPQTVVGRVLSTADALAHLKTNFYTYATKYMMDDMSEAKRQEWAKKKIVRDFYQKIAFEDIRQATRPDYEKLAAHFNISDSV